MALYVYRCLDCRFDKDVTHGMSEDPDIVCPKCGDKMVRVPSTRAFSWKNGGW